MYNIEKNEVSKLVILIHRDDVFVGPLRPPLGFSVTPIPLGSVRVKKDNISFKK